MKIPAKKSSIPLLLALAVLVVGGIAITNIHRTDQVVPPSVTRKAAFTVLEPDPKLYLVDKQTITFSSEGVLSYKTTGNNTLFTVTQQQVPDSFNDIPQVYPALLNKMHQYAEVSTSAGTVTLTHPEELKGAQTAVLRSSRGTLIFVRPDRDLSESQWKDFFNSLQSD